MNEKKNMNRNYVQRTREKEREREKNRVLAWIPARFSNHERRKGKDA